MAFKSQLSQEVISDDYKSTFVLKCNRARPLSRPKNLLCVAVVPFFLYRCVFLIFLGFFISIRARCNWPQLLQCPCQCSFCLFVCFFGEPNKKINLSKLENYGILYKFASESYPFWS